MLLLAVCVTCALIVERITFAWVCMIFYLFNQGPDRKSVWFVSSLIQNASNVVAAVLSGVFRLMSFSVRGTLWIALILVLWGVAYVCALHAAEALVAFQTTYNSSVGGAFRLAIVVPMQIAQLLWDGVVPVYNLVVYCIKTVPTRILLENVLRNMGDFENAVINLSLFVQSTTTSLFNYVQIIINQPDSFDPNLRLLDLVTPLAYMRLAVSYMLSWLGNMCSVASSLIDIVLYPFLDINFGLGVHNVVNAALTLFIQVPAVTVERCKAGGGPVVYCLPDFEPVIELAVLGVRNFGYLIDNWLDVTAIIIQSVLTNTSPACSGWTVANFDQGGGLMGNNETVILGVDANFFAKTDGWNIELYSRNSVQSFAGAFPLMANINYGIALVSATADVEGLLGCTCTDQAYGMQILCAVAPLDQLTPSYFVPVEFDVPSTSFYMGCSKAKIRVESIRWPVTRYTSPNSNSKGSPVAQAAVWVRPDCSSEQIDVDCVSTFQLSNCFPFCMALWTKGYTGSMVLRGADEWSNSVSMVSRDCGLHDWDLKSGEISSVTQTLRQNSGVFNTWMNAEVQLNGTRCVYAPNTFSRMVRSSTSAYDAYRYVLMPGQPFAFAGDLALTVVNTAADVYGIDVQRIWGNQVSAMCSAITRLNRAVSSSDSGPHRSMSSMHSRMRSSDSRLALGLSQQPKWSASTPATCLRVSMHTVRFGSSSSSWIALEKLIILRACFRPLAACRSVRSAAVSGRVVMRASVWEAFFRSLPVNVERKSSASMCPSSVTRTVMPAAIASNGIADMFKRRETAVFI